MRPLTLAGLIALLVIPAIKADDRPAQTAASATTSKADQASQRPEGPIAKQYQQLLAEFEAEQIVRRRVHTKTQSTPAKPVVSDQRPRDLIAHYARRMVDLALSSPADPGGRDALLWVIDQPGRGDMGRMEMNLPGHRSIALKRWETTHSGNNSPENVPPGRLTGPIRDPRLRLTPAAHTPCPPASTPHGRPHTGTRGGHRRGHPGTSR